MGALFCQTCATAYTMKFVFGSKPDSIGYNIMMFCCFLGFAGDWIENNFLNYALIMQPEDDLAYSIACRGTVFKIWFTICIPCSLELFILTPAIWLAGIRYLLCTVFCGTLCRL